MICAVSKLGFTHQETRGLAQKTCPTMSTKVIPSLAWLSACFAPGYLRRLTRWTAIVIGLNGDLAMVNAMKPSPRKTMLSTCLRDNSGYRGKRNN